MATMKMVMKDGKSVPAFAADGIGKSKNGGKVSAKKKYAAGGRVVPTVDNSMSNGGKVMAKKSMGGKVMAKKAMPKKGMGGKMKGAC